jgi:hypothetical protein
MKYNSLALSVLPSEWWIPEPDTSSHELQKDPHRSPARVSAIRDGSSRIQPGDTEVDHLRVRGTGKCERTMSDSSRDMWTHQFRPLVGGALLES